MKKAKKKKSSTTYYLPSNQNRFDTFYSLRLCRWNNLFENWLSPFLMRGQCYEKPLEHPLHFATKKGLLKTLPKAKKNYPHKNRFFNGEKKCYKNHCWSLSLSPFNLFLVFSDTSKNTKTGCLFFGIKTRISWSYLISFRVAYQTWDLVNQFHRFYAKKKT